MSDRLFDVTPRQGGDDQGGGGLEQPADPVGRGVERGGQHDDRVVPQVDGIGALADPAEWFDPEDAAQLGPGMDGDGDDQRGQEGEQDHPPRVQESLVLVGLPEQGEDPEQRDGADQVEYPAGVGGDRGELSAAGQHHGQRRSDEEGEDPGVGPVVDPGGIATGRVEDGHLDGRGGSQPQGQQHPGPLHVDPAEPDQQDQRPDQVELLLDGQRPEVPERRRRTELGEVGDVLEDEPPVAGVEDPGQDIAAHGGELVPVEQGGPPDGHEHHHEEGRQQTSGPADPEVLQPDPLVTSVLGHQKVGDEITGEDEEDLHAEEPAEGPPEIQVIGDDRQHGDGPDAVQSGEVGTGALYWSGHVTPLGAVRPDRYGPRP